MQIPAWIARVETARCTGHCCDPVMLDYSPGDLRRLAAAGRFYPADRVLPEILKWIRWRPPAAGGWPETGNHEYHCIHFDAKRRICRIYGNPRPRLCELYPYYDHGRECKHPGCTRRTAPAEEAARRVAIGLD